MKPLAPNKDATRMEKARKTVNSLHRVYLTRQSRLENHIGERYQDPEGCPKCVWVSPGETGMPWGVDYCLEAERLKRMMNRVASRAKVITLLILENMEAFR